MRHECNPCQITLRLRSKPWCCPGNTVRHVRWVPGYKSGKPVDLYEPLSEGLPPEDTLNEVQLFEKGVVAYQHRNFDEAQRIINALHEKDPHQLYWSYLNRIEGFIKSPPPDNWGGAERRQQLPVNKLLTK